MDLWLDEIRSSVQNFFRPGWVAGEMVACGFFLVLFSAVMITPTVSAQPFADYQTAPAVQGTTGGKDIFDQKCSGCHSIGGGKLVGPDLKDVTKRRDPQWIKNFLLDPPKMLDSDPIAQQLLKENNNVRMPNLSLSADQVDLLIEFLSAPGAVPSAPATTVSPGAGDPVAGKQLFTGERPLTNGGPACMSCHTVSGAGSLGGGGLGPDLTQVIQRLGEPGLAGALKTIAFPTMLGPFQNHPLTTQEQADLVAFFKDSNRWQDPVLWISPGALTPNALRILGIGLAIAGLLFGLLLFFWVRIKKRTTLRLPMRKVLSVKNKASSQGDFL